MPFTHFQIVRHERDRRFYIEGWYAPTLRQCVGECRTLIEAEALKEKIEAHQLKARGKRDE